MYQPDEAADDHVRVVAEAVQWADVFLLGTPDYHGSMSGAIKNFLDYHWAEFAGKLFGYVCASHEKGLTVMDHLRTAVRRCYGWSLPYGVSIHGHSGLGRSHDGRIRRWAYIDAEAKYLRVILLDDGETVHNAFFDRDFKP